MKFKKKVAALVLASAMTLAWLPAATATAPPPVSPAAVPLRRAPPPAAPLEISLWSFNIGGFTEASNWDSLIAAFNEANPDIKVTVTPSTIRTATRSSPPPSPPAAAPTSSLRAPERIVGNYAREGLMVDLGDGGAMPPRILARIFPVSASWTGPTTCTPERGRPLHGHQLRGL